MSGSPVYVDGKLVGAIAYRIGEFSKEPIAGVTPIGEMLDAMVPIYQKHLSKGDLESILAFYSSPVGRKLLREQPAMMQESMEVGGKIGRQRIGAMSEKIDEFISKLAQEEEKKTK